MHGALSEFFLPEMDERFEDDWIKPYNEWGHGMKQLI